MDGLALFNSYLNKQQDSFKPCLIALRNLVLSIAPYAEETFSYQVHCFKHHYMLVGIGVTKDFCSLYTMSPKLVKSMKDELKGCKVSGTTIHFSPADALPEPLITKIILERIRQNELLAATRKK
ncbi:iron chaperone [Mucilaginibacter xinganensis]|uniref:YdhG-like domain-containing protein n=1 Tax=Mucilaginibacter xinganensis TaxID=1234841 RepID=A0A223P1N9_9SPHI|nr:DUF1801 domain-containing protein [Mucilaginibacter xinganensis]ASU35854.1 hypothetical protein MuYL_3969 [Mucilaginibacter xinganensis]